MPCSRTGTGPDRQPPNENYRARRRSHGSRKVVEGADNLLDVAPRRRLPECPLANSPRVPRDLSNLAGRLVAPADARRNQVAGLDQHCGRASPLPKFCIHSPQAEQARRPGVMQIRSYLSIADRFVRLGIGGRRTVMRIKPARACRMEASSSTTNTVASGWGMTAFTPWWGA